MSSKQSSQQQSPFAQLVINFALPIFILNRFSSESQLGPVQAMLLALAFPVVFEIFNVIKRRKLSWLSVVAIVGIVVTGAISLLGLSEDWLAARRSLPYLVMSLALLIAIKLNRPLVNFLLPQLIDTEKLDKVSKQKKVTQQIEKALLRTNYAVALIFLYAAVGSFLLTQIVITGDAGSTQFNQEYARLRLLSIPFGTVPLLFLFAGCLIYLFTKIEKLTGLDADMLMKKKPKD